MKPNHRHDASADETDGTDHPASDDRSFAGVLAARLSRRGVLRGGLGGAAAMLLGRFGSPASASASDAAAAASPGPAPVSTFNFKAVAKSLEDEVHVPDNYHCEQVYAVGDPINNAVAPYRNDGTDGGFDYRAGDHHDGMNYFGLNDAGTARDPQGSTRGILAINHENVTAAFLHSNGPTTVDGVRPQREVDNEIAAHGVSIIEVHKSDGKFQVNRTSNYNRRYTAQTPLALAGPVKGTAHVKTAYSNDGTRARGTLNNCATGDTPWGTFLTCEENWSFCFVRASDDDAKRSANERTSLNRYGLPASPTRERNWHTAGTSDIYTRWDITKRGVKGDGTDDFSNEANTFGYVVEIDPYNAGVSAKKRTHLGRFAHECAVYAKPVTGEPLVFYMGDDSKNEYIYKYVSKARWDHADSTKGMAAGDKYLDEGTLYVARFNDDGTGEWIALNIGNPKIAGFAGYTFKGLADICVNTRLAGDAVGATKMDRPEWCSVNPTNGDVYFTLTNNNNRVLDDATPPKLLPGPPNPRAYEHKNAKLWGNANGHIIRTAESGGAATATSFKWDIYVFGASSGAGASINLSALGDDNDFSSPDGIWFAPNGVLWIQTDDNAYSEVTNCMMLAALPGQVGDGGVTKVVNKMGDKKLEVTTHKGKNPNGDTLRRFLVGPPGCEITGIAQTPDYKTMFVNIQHPGEDVEHLKLADPKTYQSHWPAGRDARPRSATVVITRKDGGTIGI